MIDDIWLQIVPFFKRPGPAPVCSDSELLTMIMVDECRDRDIEMERLSYWQEHRDLFPRIPIWIVLNGTILDFVRAPANQADLEIGFEMLTEHQDLLVLGDKAYISAEKADQWPAFAKHPVKGMPRRSLPG